MQIKRTIICLLVIGFLCPLCYAQNIDTLQIINGFILDETVNPLPYSHVINLRSGRGTTSGPSGKFILSAINTDSILIRNLSYEDYFIEADEIRSGDTIHLTIRFYAIKEVRIFEWGSSYADFKVKMLSMPVTENWGEKLGLPKQTGNPIPNFRNADALNNPMFALSNPIDFLYFNLNKKQQSVRKVIEFQQNEELIRRFESVYNRKSISALTGLIDDELDKFLIYLNLEFQCDFNCSEIQIVEEIYMFWNDYRGKRIGYVLKP